MFRCEEGVPVVSSRLRVVEGGAVPQGPLATDPWEYQAECVDAFVTFLTGLRRAGATWAIVAPAGPSDRMEMIARTVLPQVAGRT